MENRDANQCEPIIPQPSAGISSPQESAPDGSVPRGGVLPAVALLVAIVLSGVLLPVAGYAAGSKTVAGRVLLAPVVIGSMALSLFSILLGISRKANNLLPAKYINNWMHSSQSVPFEMSMAGIALLASFVAWGWEFHHLLSTDHQVFSEKPEAALYWSERLLPVWIPLLTGMSAMLVCQVSLWTIGNNAAPINDPAKESGGNGPEPPPRPKPEDGGFKL